MAREKPRILAVDDEALNLEIIEHALKKYGYPVTCVDNGGKALILLNESPETFQIVLLDRMMPVMDGMEVLARIRDNPRLKHLVVILQTAASNREQIAEGMRAGAYYYLSKPYNKETMLKVVEAAAAHIQQRTRRLDAAGGGMVGNTEECEFLIQSLTDVELTALYLANLCPHPDAVLPGIRALLLNAVEHGNLCIGFHLKGELLREGRWEEEIERRLALPENSAKRAVVTFRKTATEITITVKDQGQGFDWKRHTEIDPTRTMDSHGKGIAITSMRCFDKLEYDENGSLARGIILLATPAESARKPADRQAVREKPAPDQW